MVGLQTLNLKINVRIIIPQPLEVITIRKLLTIFLVLVVITSLSVTAFAAGEQPSGSSYTYITATGSSGTNTYWYSVTQSIYQIGQWLKPLKDSNYRYFDGTSTASTNNFFTALANSLYYIGANVRTNFTSLISDTGTIASRISTTNSTLATISSEKLPTQSGYSYDNNSGSVSNQTYWSATSNQLTFIFRRLATLNTNIEDIESSIQNYTTQLNSINSNTNSIKSYTSSTATNTSSIATSTDSIDGKLPSRNYGYINANGQGVTSTDSTYNWWSAMANNFYNTFPKIFSIDSKLPTGFYSYIRQNGTIGVGAYNYWSAVTYSLANMGEDIHASTLDIDDLHYMFASPEDIALKQDQENNISVATSNFLSGSDSATSVGTQSIGKVKDLGDDVSSFFDTGVQATSLFDSLSDTSSDGPWLWFSSAVRDNLTGSQSRSNSKSSNLPGEQVVDFYSDKMAALNKLLGEVSNDD